MLDFLSSFLWCVLFTCYPQLGDFGISKSMAHTMANAITRIGTPYYLSPYVSTCKHTHTRTSGTQNGAASSHPPEANVATRHSCTTNSMSAHSYSDFLLSIYLWIFRLFFSISFFLSLFFDFAFSSFWWFQSLYYHLWYWLIIILSFPLVFFSFSIFLMFSSFSLFLFFHFFQHFFNLFISLTNIISIYILMFL